MAYDNRSGRNPHRNGRWDPHGNESVTRQSQRQFNQRRRAQNGVEGMRGQFEQNAVTQAVQTPCGACPRSQAVNASNRCGVMDVRPQMPFFRVLTSPQAGAFSRATASGKRMSRQRCRGYACCTRG